MVEDTNWAGGVKRTVKHRAMPKTKLNLEGWWVYVGPYGERGLKHRVTFADSEFIYTWSKPSLAGGDCAGWSWMGEASMFQKEFRKAT